MRSFGFYFEIKGEWIMIEINLKVGKEAGLMKFCIPYETIKSIVGKIDIKSWLFTEVEPNSPEK